MNQEEKARVYDDLIREGDKVNRRISQIKTNVNRTPEAERELNKLKETLSKLEVRMEQLFSQG